MPGAQGNDATAGLKSPVGASGGIPGPVHGDCTRSVERRVSRENQRSNSQPTLREHSAAHHGEMRALTHLPIRSTTVTANRMAGLSK